MLWREVSVLAWVCVLLWSLQVRGLQVLWGSSELELGLRLCPMVAVVPGGL